VTAVFTQIVHRQLRFIITLFLLLVSTPILFAAEPGDRGWTIGPSIGVHWGGAREIVYDNSGAENDNEYLSLLTWDLQPVVVMGIDARWESGKAGGLDLIFRSAIPGMATGEMNDYDWLTVNDPVPTYWSVSDIWMRWGFIFDAGYDWNLISKGYFSLNAGLGYHFDWWAWRDITKDSSYGLVTDVSGIDYSAAYHVPMISLMINLDCETFFINTNGRIGPVLAFSHDHHKLRTDPTFTGGPDNVDGLNFYDNAFGGPWIDLEVSVGFRSKGKFSFELKGEYAWMRGTKGNSLVVFSDGVTSPILYKDAAGFAFQRIGVTALFSWDLSGP